MGQSLVINPLHIVFSTKYRKPLIDNSIETELHEYLGGICKRMGFVPVKVGGYYDHIHILCFLSKNTALCEFMMELKSNSSKWIKTKGNRYKEFFWQDGYGAFAVCPERIDTVANYIANQHEHHKNQSFKKEYREILDKHDADYDERYVWD